MLVRFDIAMEDQGITGKGIEWFGGASQHAQRIELTAAGKRIGVIRDYCNGKKAGTETTFSGPDEKLGGKLTDEVTDAALWPALDWKTLYKTVSIAKLDKVDGTDVFVVEKKTASGRTTTDFVSAATFLVVKTEASGSTQTLSDYRDVLGVKLPFTRLVTAPTGTRNVLQVREVKFNVKPAPSLFAPSALGQPPRAPSLPMRPWS